MIYVYFFQIKNLLFNVTPELVFPEDDPNVDIELKIDYTAQYSTTFTSQQKPPAKVCIFWVFINRDIKWCIRLCKHSLV